MKPRIHLVWFKRDLRLHDHAPLTMACAQGAVLPLFAWEPAVWSGDDASLQQAMFVRECLESLSQQMQRLGLTLMVWPSGMIDALNHLQKHYVIAGLYSHEETGNAATFLVDRQVKSWCETHAIPWTELYQNGVVRRLKSRNTWAQTWEKRMREPLLSIPQWVQGVPSMPTSNLYMPSLAGVDKPHRQQGGFSHASVVLHSFLSHRSKDYRFGISSPMKAVSASSRLSPYLAWGVLSLKEVRQKSQQAQASAIHQAQGRSIQSGLQAFESRLHWHCHFMQKLETEPSIEFQAFHPLLDQLRRSQPSNSAKLHAWMHGQTGWPLVDACMLMLRATGWLNFRMRAMLMSTASYLLWLDWRTTGLHLAREFLDYEPGIHWSQVQMQSGTTGINTIRVYNPVKQAMDQDADGRFVRQWLPALRRVPNHWIFEPWHMPPHLQQQYGCVLDRDYPLPLVDIHLAAQYAKQQVSAVHREIKDTLAYRSILERHASRKGQHFTSRNTTGSETMKKTRVSGPVKHFKQQQMNLFDGYQDRE